MVARWPDCLALARCRLGEAPGGAGPMTVISVVPDQQAHTLTLTAQYAAPVEDVWQLWADPRQLERWWGTPTHPATVLDHDLRVGGRVRYVMTGPEGDQHAGWGRSSTTGSATPTLPRLACRSRAPASRSATSVAVSYTHLRAHETVLDLVCR